VDDGRRLHPPELALRLQPHTRKDEVGIRRAEGYKIAQDISRVSLEVDSAGKSVLSACEFHPSQDKGHEQDTARRTPWYSVNYPSRALCTVSPGDGEEGSVEEVDRLPPA
jgi:hypothetical protein